VIISFDDDVTVILLHGVYLSLYALIYTVDVQYNNGRQNSAGHGIGEGGNLSDVQ
jgi:hypothetical protein